MKRKFRLIPRSISDAINFCRVASGFLNTFPVSYRGTCLVCLLFSGCARLKVTAATIGKSRVSHACCLRTAGTKACIAVFILTPRLRRFCVFFVQVLPSHQRYFNMRRRMHDKPRGRSYKLFMSRREKCNTIYRGTLVRNLLASVNVFSCELRDYIFLIIA